MHIWIVNPRGLLDQNRELSLAEETRLNNRSNVIRFADMMRIALNPRVRFP